MALTISTGFVVDDAIVVIENITRHLESGMKPVDAALRGAREIGFTVFSMSTSLVAVFIPILLMGGIVGRLFREFAVTLSAAIAISLVVSLTTTPMMCAKFLTPPGERKHGRLYHWSENAFDRLRRGYEHGLDFVLEHSLPVLLVTFATIGFTIYLYVIIPKGFFPQQDTGRLNGNVQASQDTSFAALIQKLNIFMHIVEKDPAVENVVSFTGGGRGGGNTASMFISLKPLNVRKASAQDIITRLRPKTAHVPGAQMFLTAVQDVRGRRSSRGRCTS